MVDESPCTWAKNGVNKTPFSGWYTLAPYMTLQAYGLGLTYKDIGIIYLVTPLVSLAASPISG